ncbi:MAG TPA: helix-turn-helix domain-containing protein [Mycobacterium sp.]|nr:helix-turn-helix domain-containing protein [Mycobacterium sp.]HUH71026.1 helix-turn-helix domain-containing protein [Mycobacterium sp.]
MALPREYTSEDCAIARSLEVIGERWTLLIVRDAFYGVRRFSDFHAHLGLPKAVLSERLTLLVDNGVLAAVSGPSGRDWYELTPRGQRLWPTVWSLITWGNENFYESSSRRTYRHAECGGMIDRDRVCKACAAIPEPGDLVVHPPKNPRNTREDPISVALRRPHRLLRPLTPDP